MSNFTACQDCAAPITQPVGGGHPRVLCAACAAQREAQRHRERAAARTPVQRVGKVQRDREYNLQKNYGIGIAEFDALLAAQDGRCAICGTDAPNGKGWHVDHNHESGAVRGILCHGCNIGIGHLNDDPAILRGAIAYLESRATAVTS